MAEPNSVDLHGKISDIGVVHFLRAEWKNPNPDLFSFAMQCMRKRSRMACD